MMETTTKHCLLSVMVLLVLAILEARALSSEKYQHLPYALRNRFSGGSLTRRSLNNDFMDEKSVLSSTKPSSTSKNNNLNYFVTHHIEDIERFFDETIEGPVEHTSNSLPTDEENRSAASSQKSHKHAGHHHHQQSHHNKHSSTSGAHVKIHSTRKPKQISQKRTIKNPVDQANSDYVSATVGKDVQLDCKIKNVKTEDERILWMRMPKGEILAFNSNRVTNDLRVTPVCGSNAISSCSLTISDTRESDTGFYACQTNDMKSKYVYLDIMVPPKLLTQYPVDRLDVNQSSNASITCEFYGKPQPLVKWYKYHNKHQKEIEAFRGLKTIEIFIGPDSPNEYECVADNSIPPIISKKIFLNIQYAPKIKFQNSRVFQKKGERVIFDCSIQANPEARVFWFKDKTRLSESSKYNIENVDNKFYRLYVNNLTATDFGDYYCTASNSAGESTSKIELHELPGTEEKSQIKSTNNPLKQAINLGNANPAGSGQKKLIKQTSKENFELQTVFDGKLEESVFSINKSANSASEGYILNENDVHLIDLQESSTKPTPVSVPVLIKAGVTHANSNHLGLAVHNQVDKNSKNLRNSYKVILAGGTQNTNQDESPITKNNFENENDTPLEAYKLNDSEREDSLAPTHPKKSQTNAQANGTLKNRYNKPPYSRSNNHHHRNQSDDSTVNKKSNLRKSGGAGGVKKSNNNNNNNNQQHAQPIPSTSTLAPEFFRNLDDPEIDDIIMTDSAGCVARQNVLIYLVVTLMTSLLIPYIF